MYFHCCLRKCNPNKLQRGRGRDREKEREGQGKRGGEKENCVVVLLMQSQQQLAHFPKVLAAGRGPAQVDDGSAIEAILDNPESAQWETKDWNYCISQRGEAEGVEG